MATFTLGIHHYTETGSFTVLESQFEDGTEQRRKVSDNQTRVFDCESPTLTEAEIDAYRAFYDARGGTFEAFTWDSINVKFVGPMKIEHHFDGWKATWSFKLVN